MKVGGRVGDANRDFAACQNRPGIEPGLHQHGADAGDAVAGGDGALDRRRAAPSWQQRGMAIDTAETRHCQNRWRQDQPIGDNDEDIGFERSERGGVLFGFQARRMTKLEAMAGGVRGERLWCLAHAPAAAPWWLRVDGDDVMVRGKPDERRDGDSRASPENDPPACHRLPGRRH